MDYHNPLNLLHMVEESDWVNKVNMARVDGRICTWAQGFHPKNLSCRLHGGFLNGAYNLGQKLVFDDETAWFLRLPRASSVSPEYADEKTAMEVEAIHLIREKTSIPVPEIYAWGFSEENSLGLGPFMLMSFIDGVRLNDVFTEGGSRLLKEGIPDADIEYVYRQMARFILQLFKIDFERIGSLPTPRTKYPAPSRPLTWKVHEILRAGGVNTFGNVIVRSKDDLTIAGVVDLEWAYAGPAQLFGSAPWWLLMDRPVNSEWDFEEEEAPKATDRYFKCLEIYKRVLAEEEANMTGNQEKQLSELLQWSEDSGAMWLHMLLSSGFFDTPSFPCMQLQKHRGAEWWDERMDEYRHTEEVETFVSNKMDDLAAYDKVEEKVEHYKALMDSKEMTTEDFIYTVSTLLSSS
ncbi:hypothetical protein CNMCM7691_008067 [Aspergillus felis]|uniref:Aminoglycoside phosphotransferase domain-containing protein n=1 Tax=Aspergillus felis TaxID=1287682 RepID=A0A8H6QWF6_9EURO|nr:hypothetical protein CNMCM7691_008067 [Aspergillus felis]